MEIPNPLPVVMGAFRSALTDHPAGYVTVESHPGVKRYELSRDQVVRKGRYRELHRSLAIVTGLFLAQYPMRAVVQGTWTPARSYQDERIRLLVPVRMSLVLDTMLIIALVLLAYRAARLVRLERPGARWTKAWNTAVAVVLLGAAMDVWENIILWHRHYQVPAATALNVSVGTATGISALSGVSWSDIKFGMFVAGLLSLGLMVASTRLTGWRAHRHSSTGPEPIAPSSPVDEVDPAEEEATELGPSAGGSDLVICCSGGGIRSSAFSLGGLQVLAETTGRDFEGTVYDNASAVIGVSGGGYVAAAFHTLRAASVIDGEKEALRPPPFSDASPELQWVRRHTRYVLDSGRVAVDAVLSLAFGIAVNLVLLFVAVGGLAWVASWFLLASGRITPETVPTKVRGVDESYGTFASRDWSWAGHLWWVAAAGPAVFVLMRFADYLIGLPRWGRTFGLRSAALLLTIGLVLVAIIDGIPWVLEGIQQWATGSGSPLARLLYETGLVPTSMCRAVSDAHAACGFAPGKEANGGASRAWVSAGGAAGIVGSLVAVLGTLRGSGNGVGSSKWLGRIWVRIKGHVVPWTAVTVIVLVITVVLLRWVVGLTDSGVDHGGVPNLELWTNVAWVAGILVVIRVCTEPNRTSLHHFLRERISYAFLLRRKPGGVEPVPYTEPWRFSEAGGIAGPALVTCAVANVTDADLVPPERGCTPFVFDSDCIGLTDSTLPQSAARRGSAGYEFAADYRYRDATIPAAVAMSAAAFSPMAGRENVRLAPYRVALALANARLGVWLPNPLWQDEVQGARRLLRLGRVDEAVAAARRLTTEQNAELAHGWPLEKLGRAELFAAAVGATNEAAEREAVERLSASLTYTGLWHVLEYARGILTKPGLTRVVREAVGKASVYDRFLYVTDGGHYDNLGLLEALRRRPDEIVVIDASNDPLDTFRTLGRAIATAQMDLNCEVRIDPRAMRTTNDERPQFAWCSGEAWFKDVSPIKVTKVHVIKALLFENLPWDVETYGHDNQDFPRSSTANQLYGEFDFEAYRMLGRRAMLGFLDAHDMTTAIEVEPDETEQPAV